VTSTLLSHSETVADEDGSVPGPRSLQTALSAVLRAPLTNRSSRALRRPRPLAQLIVEAKAKFEFSSASGQVGSGPPHLRRWASRGHGTAATGQIFQESHRKSGHRAASTAGPATTREMYSMPRHCASSIAVALMPEAGRRASQFGYLVRRIGSGACAGASNSPTRSAAPRWRVRTA
jgi:hypothetical protein